MRSEQIVVSLVYHSWNETLTASQISHTDLLSEVRTAPHCYDFVPFLLRQNVLDSIGCGCVYHGAYLGPP
jgi:hypothetical protein